MNILSEKLMVLPNCIAEPKPLFGIKVEYSYCLPFMSILNASFAPRMMFMKTRL